MKESFPWLKARRIIKAVDWETWIKKPGLAPVHLDFTTKALNESSALADEYITLGGASSPANYKDYLDFYSGLRVIFLERLNTREDAVSLEVLQKVDADLDVTSTLDPECKARWFPLGIKKGYQAVVEPAHQLVSTVGRLKYLTPIYQALLDSDQKATAIQWFEENIDFYHPLAVSSLKKLLGLDADTTPDEETKETPTTPPEEPNNSLQKTIMITNTLNQALDAMRFIV